MKNIVLAAALALSTFAAFAEQAPADGFEAAYVEYQTACGLREETAMEMLGVMNAEGRNEYRSLLGYAPEMSAATSALDSFETAYVEYQTACGQSEESAMELLGMMPVDARNEYRAVLGYPAEAVVAPTLLTDFETSFIFHMKSCGYTAEESLGLLAVANEEGHNQFRAEMGYTPAGTHASKATTLASK